VVNQLHFGDNLQVLKYHIQDESVDPSYLDPPFNSKRDYNLLFKSPKGHEGTAVRERESAEIALFISLEEPTRGAVKDAANAGFYESASRKKYPRVQLLAIEGWLSGQQRAEPPDHAPDLNFKKPRPRARRRRRS